VSVENCPYTHGLLFFCPIKGDLVGLAFIANPVFFKVLPDNSEKNGKRVGIFLDLLTLYKGVVPAGGNPSFR